MSLRRQWLSSGLAAVAVLFTACSQDSDSVLGTSAAMSNVVETGYIDLYKIGPAGTYAFTASETGSGLLGTNFLVPANAPKTIIWQQGDPAAGNSDVTITETAVPGIQVDSIRVVKFISGVLASSTLYVGTNTAVLADANNTTDWGVKFYNSVLPPPPGGQGCTPGYWRQSQHFDSWTGYAPTDMFATVFGVSYSGTLLQAVSSGGGGVNALARHSVAALLNAASSGVDYPATTAEVIAAVQAAFASGNFEAQKNIFEGWNEAGCDLD